MLPPTPNAMEQKKLPIPKGWDITSIQQAADQCVRQIDAYLTDPRRTECFDRYGLAQDCFDDKKVPSQLVIIREVDPKNYPLLKMQVKGATRMVVSAFNGADPFYIFKGGKDSDLRDAREHDTQIALETDNYKPKLRETARLAAIQARGPFRIVWEEKPKGAGWLDAAQVKDGEFEFVGPRRETIRTEDFGLYPLSVKNIAEARSVWHRFDRPMYEIWEMQDRGEYFSRELVDVSPEHEQNTVADQTEDYAPNLYTGIFKLPPGMDKSKPLVAYRMTIVHGQRKCLYMEPYTLPYPEYFAPGFEYDPGEFWPTHSLGSSILEMQAEMNDIMFARLMAAVAAIKKTVLASGFVGEQTSYPMLLGDIMTFTGNPKFHTVDTSSTGASDLGAQAQDVKYFTQGVTGFSEIAAGQLPEASQSATASGGALQGTADEGEEKRQNFLEEEIRAVQFIQILIHRNFKNFKKFHGDRLQTKKASDWKEQFTIGANGQGPNNNPQVTLEKIKLLIESYMGMSIPWLEDVEAGTAPNIGIALSKKETAKIIQQNLDLPFNSEKIIVETDNLAIPPIDDAEGDIGPIGGPEAILGPGAQYPDELLALLGAGGSALPVPPQLPPGAPPMAFGEYSIPPELLSSVPGVGMPLV